MSRFYYDEERKQIWVVGEDDVWSSRTHIYNADGEYLDYDDSDDYCSEWCENLNCETLEEAITIVRKKEMLQVTIIRTYIPVYRREAVCVWLLDDSVKECDKVVISQQCEEVIGIVLDTWTQEIPKDDIYRTTLAKKYEEGYQLWNAYDDELLFN